MSPGGYVLELSLPHNQTVSKCGRLANICWPVPLPLYPGPPVPPVPLCPRHPCAPGPVPLSNRLSMFSLKCVKFVAVHTIRLLIVPSLKVSWLRTLGQKLARMMLVVLVDTCRCTWTAATSISCPSDDAPTCCGQAGHRVPSTLATWLRPASTIRARPTKCAATPAERRSLAGRTATCRWTSIDAAVPPVRSSSPSTAGSRRYHHRRPSAVDTSRRGPSSCLPTFSLTAGLMTASTLTRGR